MDEETCSLNGLELHAHEQRRRAWLQASIEVTRGLLLTDGEEPLSKVARVVNALAEADLTLVVLPIDGGERLMIEVAVGEATEDLVGFVFDDAGSVSGEVMRTGQSLLACDVTERLSVERMQTAYPAIVVGPIMAVPLVGERGARGALAISRRFGSAPFNHEDLELATSFANHAAIALELADARAHQQRMIHMEDRHRIANELHDHVLQRLFAAGMTMQAISASVGEPYAQRLLELITDTDETIGRIRGVIHDLNDLGYS